MPALTWAFQICLKAKESQQIVAMIKRTFLEKGLPYASELALQNCKDLFKILQVE